MIVCPSCGTKIRFCLTCGYPLPKARTESLEELSLKIKHLLTCESPVEKLYLIVLNVAIFS